MRVKMLTLACGPSGTLHADQVYDLPSDQARAFISSGHAVADVQGARPTIIPSADKPVLPDKPALPEVEPEKAAADAQPEPAPEPKATKPKK